MKKVLFAFAFIGLLCWCASAQNSLYDQEGTPADTDHGINAAGVNSAPDADWTNWKYQKGGGTWSGVYGDTGWIEESFSGDATIVVECDIEMYYTEEFSNNEIYFHLGNIYDATIDDKRAIVDGTFTSNNGMYIGICFDGTGKTTSNMEGYPDALTGRVLDGMTGDKDVLGRDISTQNFDILFEFSWGAGWRAPDSYGDGASGTIHDTLWWLINDGNPGTYDVMWRVTVEPEAHQPDGNYYLDPLLVNCPVL